MMYGTLSLWKILLKQGATVSSGIPMEQMPTYGAIVMLIPSLLYAAYGIRHYIAGQVRSGKLELDLLKPVSFVPFMLMNNFGDFVTSFLMFGIPGYLFAVFILKVQQPKDLATAGLFLLSLFLGYLIFFAFNMLVGMLSIITLNISSYTWTIDTIVAFASGMVVPLSLFPNAIRTVLYFLPFQNLYYAPLSIYLNTAKNIYIVLAVQLLWVVILFFLAQLAWLAINKKVQIQGG